MKTYVFPFLSAVFLLAGCTTFSDDGTPAIRKGNDSILSFGKLGSAIEDAPAGGWVMLDDQYTYETFAKFLSPNSRNLNTGFRLFLFQISTDSTQIPP
ncbi:TPA: hypothetical protein ACFP3W_001142 [Neisseria subflava]